MVKCDYCGREAVLVDSAEIYGRSYGMIWLCRPCFAWVGCHANSKRHAPLGRLANAELREWRKRAHAAFDPLWMKKMVREDCTKSAARQAGYAWLADQLGMSPEECHIGHFDIAQCEQVVAVCTKVGRLSSNFDLV